jgi:hypothetical protein
MNKLNSLALKVIWSSQTDFYMAAVLLWGAEFTWDYTCDSDQEV